MSINAPIYANTYTSESTAVSGGTTITVPFYARKIVITNDSSSADLTFYFHSSATANTGITLKPTETFTADRFRTTAVLLVGNNVPYRLWCFG